MRRRLSKKGVPGEERGKQLAKADAEREVPRHNPYGDSERDVAHDSGTLDEPC